MENIGRRDLLDLLEELRSDSESQAKVLEKLILLLIDGIYLEADTNSPGF